MSAILFLSNSPNFSYNFNPISNTNLKHISPYPFSNYLINPKTPICSSNPPKSNSSTIDNKDETLLRPNNMPTAPWMKGPLLLEPNQILDLSKSRKSRKVNNGQEKNPNSSLTDRVSGGRNKKTMKRVFQGIGKLQESPNLECVESQKSPEKLKLDLLMGEFQEDERLGLARRMPWESEEKMVFRRMKKVKVVTAAELCLDEVLLKWLRAEAAKIRKWVKVKKAGVTDAVVDQIWFIWKNNELCMLKFDIPLCRNMDRAREIVELKTGGLVVWCKKDALVVYRGSNYQSSSRDVWRRHSGLGGGHRTSSLETNYNNAGLQVNSTGEGMMDRKDGEDETVSIDGSLYEREADRLLSGLGPRYVDWWRPKPLPVDADLLPEVVPGFKPPFRLCPPKASSKLKDDELTYLRNLSRPLPTHFVLGRNRELQGLAAAILKLWENCHIAKIAVKLGVPNTNNEEMANELKCLTGGVLLLRNKFMIIIYRGKDFLPCGVANLVADREVELKRCEVQEEAARLKAVGTTCLTIEPSISTSTIGTLSEFLDIQSECGDLEDQNKEVKVQLEAEKGRLEKELRQQEHKLFLLKRKIKMAVKELEKLNSAWRPTEPDEDQEIITPEEKECLRKIGLELESCLVLGRRGIFDGVLEGLHQHWKHREVAKVITMQRAFSQIVETANLLQRESGGTLISVDKLKKGHAIILYRGKNYRRPLKLVHKNLLNKRQALQRSLEMQRVGSLKFFAHEREKAISELKSKLEEKRSLKI